MDTIRRLSLILLTVTGFALLSACGEGVQPDARTLANAKDDIGQVNNAFTRAFNAKDATALANTFTDDGILMPPNQAPVKSAIAIQNYARQNLVAPLSGILINGDDIQMAGDLAYCFGYYSLLGANNAVIDRGKFVEILRHTDAGWKISRYIYNSDLPMAPSASMTPAAGTTAAPAAATH